MRRRLLATILMCGAVGVALWGRGAEPVAARASQAPQVVVAPAPITIAPVDERVRWVAAVMKEMSNVKPGVTRAFLLRYLTTEGGISTRAGRTYVSRQCPYFKMDVEFDPAGSVPAGTNAQLWEGDDDVVTRVSRPYLALTVSD